MTKQTFPTWIAAAVLALSAATVHAQTPAAGEAATTPTKTTASHPHHASHDAKGPRHDRRMDPAKRAQARAKHLAEFKQKLNLTPAQQPAWDQYQAATKPPARPAGERGARTAERESFAKLTTPQRIDAMQKRHDDMSARMKARGDATKAFYAQLTPAQQQVFDAESARRMNHRGHGKRGHQGAHGKHHPGMHGAKPAASAPAK